MNTKEITYWVFTIQVLTKLNLTPALLIRWRLQLCTVVQQFRIDLTVIKPNPACQRRNVIQPALTASRFQTVHTALIVYVWCRKALTATFRFCEQGSIQYSVSVQTPIPPQAYQPWAEALPKPSSCRGIVPVKELDLKYWQTVCWTQPGFGYSLHLCYFWITNQARVLQAMKPPSVKVTYSKHSNTNDTLQWK